MLSAFIDTQAESVPLLDKLYARFNEIAAERVVLPSSLLAKAIGYAINQREALYRYTADGRLEIDNNFAENAIRPLALGRKHYLRRKWGQPLKTKY